MVRQHIRNYFAHNLLVSGTKLLLHRTGWAIMDQAIVSLGMFFANIILARYLIPSDYGIFALLLTVSFCTTIITNNFLSYPLALRLAHAGTHVRNNERERLIMGAILMVALLCAPLSGLPAVALFCLGRPELVLPAVSSFFLWQMQFAMRSALLVDLRQREAMAGDVVSSLGFLLVLVANRGNLSLANALYYMAATYMLAIIIQVLQLRLSITALYTPYRWLIDGAPLSLVLPLLFAGGAWTFRLYGLFWLLAALEGTAAVGHLQAALTIFNALNPLYAALGNVVLAISARAFIGFDRQAAWHAARPYILVASLPVLLYLSAALLFSRFLLSVLYGQDSPFLQIGDLFPYLAISTAGWFHAELINAFFLAMQETRLVLKINLLGITAVIF